MKICLISTLYEPWLIGAKRDVSTFAKELSRCYDVIVITIRDAARQKIILTVIHECLK